MLTPETAATHLTEAGLLLDASDVTLEARDERWLARLPGDRMAWFPMNDAGRARLMVERRILRLIEARCGFRAPRLLYEGLDGWALRAMVVGTYDPTALYHRVLAEPELARRLGADLGAALAEQHTRIDPAEVAGTRTVAGWPLPEDQLWAALPKVTDDVALLKRIEAVLKRYKVEQEGHIVLSHGDLGLHNLVLDPARERLAGIFDYDGAALSDRHHDFKYLVFQQGSEALFEAAVAAYEPATGVRINRDRVMLYNTACAIGFLAFRLGHPPEEVWCGRTLADDLDWVGRGLARIGL